jgi:hypothetical protein
MGISKRATSRVISQSLGLKFTAHLKLDMQMLQSGFDDVLYIKSCVFFVTCFPMIR